MNKSNMCNKWVIITELYRKETEKPRASLPSDPSWTYQ